MNAAVTRDRVANSCTDHVAPSRPVEPLLEPSTADPWVTLLTGAPTLRPLAGRRPLVSTSVDAAGIQPRDGLEILSRDVPRSFAVACLDLQGNPGKALELGARERLPVVQKYEHGHTIRELAARFSGFAGPAVE